MQRGHFLVICVRGIFMIWGSTIDSVDAYIQHALLQKTKFLRNNTMIILGVSLVQLNYQILSKTRVHRRHCLLSHKINITITTEQFKIQRLHKRNWRSTVQKAIGFDSCKMPWFWAICLFSGRYWFRRCSNVTRFITKIMVINYFKVLAVLMGSVLPQ